MKNSILLVGAGLVVAVAGLLVWKAKAYTSLTIEDILSTPSAYFSKKVSVTGVFGLQPPPWYIQGSSGAKIHVAMMALPLSQAPVSYSAIVSKSVTFTGIIIEDSAFNEGCILIPSTLKVNN